ncbi:hypothetical protein [Seonamhaeicola sp.]|uniref:hypothetical protein n=1 Tax=Seonamhaeicola sp. TaxID=1912245 RepID=UPI00261666BA|nr:hypothetical protein [Seonamhaeicola sp.]
MKRIAYIIILFSMSSCSNGIKNLYGTWNVKSNHYKATYLILNENDSVKAKVLYYNDGTSIYKESEHKSYYVFENLKPKGALYVDAISGATIKDTNKNSSIRIIHKDTIEVTTYIMHRPLKETWKRINK